MPSVYRAHELRCNTRGLLVGLHQTQSLPIHLTSVSSVNGVSTSLNATSLLSQLPRAEPRLSAPHVYFARLNGKARMCGDCGPSVVTTANAGTRIFAFPF